MGRNVNLVPMAGAGRRYLDAGYTIPKPLIPVAGRPMVVRAAACLPLPDLWIFVCRQEHILEYQIDAELKKAFQPAEILSVERLTEGQLSTCLLARNLLEDDDCLTIGPCDNAMIYDSRKFAELLSSPKCDAVIWTFRQNPAVLQNPRMYGWVDVDAQNYVRRVLVKIPLSESPMDDHAVIGAFTFNHAIDFISCAEETISQNRRTNDEFYVDEVMNVAVENGLTVRVFEVEKYICWGTPQDLIVYNYWRDYFVK